MSSRRISLGLFAISSVLLLVGLHGLTYVPDYRDRFDEELVSYDQALRDLDEAYVRLGASEAFVRVAVGTYDRATAYQWPDEIAGISPLDNWILYSMRLLDPLLLGSGLKSQNALFGKFESFRYETALGRGFGICSQNALGLADLLTRRYRVNTKVVGLGGHVVGQVDLPTGSLLVDPSTGVVMPFSITEAEADPLRVEPYYRATTHAHLWKTFERENNVTASEYGSSAYAAAAWKQLAMKGFERFADLASVVVPLLGCLVFGWKAFRLRRAGETAAEMARKLYSPSGVGAPHGGDE
jgi:hypothetical protein